MQPPDNQEEFDACYEKLTSQQKEVLHLFHLGKSDEEIKTILYKAESTIRFHITHIFWVFGLGGEERKGEWRREELRRLCQRFLNAHSRRPPQQEDEATPLPIPDSPGRLMPLNSTFYVKPHCLDRCYEEITLPGQLVRIRAPQMMGKTSLLYRMLNHAETEGYHTLSLNLRYDLDEADLGNLASFLQWFCRNVAERLNLPLDSLPTTKQDCTSYLQQQVLSQIGAPLTIALDEAEVLFEYPTIAREFFGLLRGWHEKAKAPGVGAIWDNLRLIVAHSTDDYIDLGVAESPFKNVGHVERLQPLSAEQIIALAKQYGWQWSKPQIKPLMDLVGGHPFLVQRALYCLWRKDTTWKDFLTQAPTLAGIYRTHLQTLLARLQSPLGTKASLSEALLQVIQAPTTAKLTQEQIFKLEGLGLVQVNTTPMQVSCDLYRQFFQPLL